MKVRFVPAVVATAALAVLSGCGGGGAASAEPEQPAVVGDSKAAAAALEAALDGVRESATGQFSSTLRRTGDLFLDRKMTASFDLGSGSWSGVLQQSAYGPQPNVTANIAGNAGRLYLGDPSGAKVNGKGWVVTDGMAGTDPSALNTSNLSFFEHIKATEIRTTKDGAVVSGTLPGIDAAGLLGLGTGILEGTVAIADVPDGAKVTVSLDKAGRLANVELSGRDLAFSGTSVPQGTREAVAASTYSNTFTKLGEQVQIVVPAAGDVMTMAEAQAAS